VIVSLKRTPRFGHPEVFATVGLASFLVARFVPVLAVPYQCPMRALAGIPCATCGMTHAFVRLAHGDVAGALSASPLGALLAFAAWAYAVLDLARAALGAPFPVLSARGARVAAVLGVALLLANWAWLIAREVGS